MKFITLPTSKGDVRVAAASVARLELSGKSTAVTLSGVERPTFTTLKPMAILELIDKAEIEEVAAWVPPTPANNGSGQWVLYNAAEKMYVWRYYETKGENGSTNTNHITRFETEVAAKEALKVVTAEAKKRGSRVRPYKVKRIDF